jgi:hypothetical protein
MPFETGISSLHSEVCHRILDAVTSVNYLFITPKSETRSVLGGRFVYEDPSMQARLGQERSGLILLPDSEQILRVLSRTAFQPEVFGVLVKGLPSGTTLIQLQPAAGKPFNTEDRIWPRKEKAIG